MHHLSKLVLGLLTISRVNAVPLVPRDEQVVDQNILNTLNLYEQYAAASYCPENFNGAVGGKLRCKSRNCGLVENANTQIVLPIPGTLGSTGTTGFVAVDMSNSLIVVAFRGTETFRNAVFGDLVSGAKSPVQFPVCQNPPACGMAGSGFLQTWVDVREPVMQAVRNVAAANKNFTVVATGHSLGAATAAFAALEMRQSITDRKTEWGGIASPRLGDITLANFITNQDKVQGRGRNFRVAHDFDVVPNAPGRTIGFAHVSPVYSIKTASRVNVTVSNITVIDNKPLIDNKQDPLNLLTLLTFNVARAIDAHTWYFNNVSLCNNIGTQGSVATTLWPFESVEQAVRLTDSVDTNVTTTPSTTS